MDVFVLALAALAVWGIKLEKIGSPVGADYFSTDKCTAIKGLLAVTIVFHHLAIPTQDGRLMQLFSHVGYLTVAAFFFISGYGMMKKLVSDEKYLDGFILKRINKIVIPYVIVTGIYWLLSFVIKAPYSVKDVLLGFVNGWPIAENSWYIIVSIVMYAVFWLAAMAFKRKSPLLVVLCEAVFCAFWMLISKKLGYGQWWYISNLSLPIGMLWAIYENKIIKFASNSKKLVLMAAAVLALMAISIVLKRAGNTDAFYILSSSAFAIALVTVCMKVKLGNPVQNFLGKLSMELYLIHGLFITLFRSNILNIENDAVYSALVLACSIVSAKFLSMLFKKTVIRPKCLKKAESAA